MRFASLMHWGTVTVLASGFLALLVSAQRSSQLSGDEATAPPHEVHLVTSGIPTSKVGTDPHSNLARLEEKLVALGIAFAVASQDWNHILVPNKAPMSSGQEEALARVEHSPGTVSVSAMRAPEATVAEYALTETPEHRNSTIIVPISDDRQITLVRASVTRTDKGVVWRGTVADTGETAILQWWKDGRLTGLFGYRGHIYTVMNMGGDLHAVLEVDPRSLPPDHPRVASADVRRTDAPMWALTEPDFPPPAPKIDPISPEQLKALEAKKVIIDVMMLYTKRAVSHYMRRPGDVLELAFERINDTFHNSGIGNVSIRLVHTQAVDYDERDSEQFNDLYHMVDADGPFKDVRRLRDEKHADIVGLIVDDPTGCGLSTRVLPDADDAYFVVHYSCAAITISIAHEIGHILGARHDRLIDPIDTPFPYGHGYVNTTKWRDIMSYARGCDGCLRIPYWSNPRVLYKGEPTGTLTEDNARVILEQAERVSKFR
jgi:hypothetical protein